MRTVHSVIVVICSAASLIALPAALHAQFPADVEVGSRVRVWLPEAHRQADGQWHRQLVRGSVEAIAADTLRISIPGAFGSVAVPRSSIRRLELSRGGPSRPLSAAERAVGGAIGGAISWAFMNDPRRSGGPNYRTDWQAAGVGAAWGAGIGAAIGFIFPHEQWRRVRLRR